MSPARTNYIYVDYENIQVIDLKLIHDKPHVKVILMLGSQHKKVTVDLMKEVAGVKHPGQVTVTTVEKAGRNALDMAMAYEIGRQVAVDPKAFFHILSGDGDYDALVRHLKEGGVLSAKSTVFAEIPVLVDLKKLPLKARLERVTGKLRTMKSATKDNRPNRLKSLESMIYSHFSEQLTMDDVTDVVNALKNGKHLKVSDAGKVIYMD
jgi:hypothetical protein